MAKPRIAVVLMNLGGPDRPAAVRPFLLNLFRDKNILQLPQPWRALLGWIIATARGPAARKNYDLIGGGSPIVPHTEAQADALTAALKASGIEAKCVVAMRYWHPLSLEAAQQVKDFAPDRVVLLPLYPQYSMATTKSSFEAWDAAAAKIGLDVETMRICCWPDEKGFIEASAARLRPVLERAREHGRPWLIFSAHSLPEKFLAKGEPYVWQIERTAKQIVAALGAGAGGEASEFDWRLSYQSKVGPIPWIGPSTETVLTQAAGPKAPVVIYPISFVSEHVETLVEIAMEYRELAVQLGLPYFGAAPTVGTHPTFIEGLARMVRHSLAGADAVRSGDGPRLCPSGYAACGLAGCGQRAEDEDAAHHLSGRSAARSAA